MQSILFRLTLGSFFLAAATANAGGDTRDALWAAVRDGDVKAVKARLATGTNVNVRRQISRTAVQRFQRPVRDSRRSLIARLPSMQGVLRWQRSLH